MMSLYSIELRRNLYRRITRISLIVAAAGLLMNGVTQFVTHTANPPAVGQDSFLQNCISNPDPFPAPIEGVPPTQPNSAERHELCSRVPIGFYANDERFALEKLRGGFQGMTVPLLMLAFLLGATYLGAEWRANTVATQLVWEPRRVRVHVAKMLAAATFGVVLYVIIQALVTLSLLPAGIWRGTTEGIDSQWYSDVTGTLIRGALLSGAGAVIGQAFAAIGRNTAAALGVAFGYLVILEGNLLGGFFPGLRRWLFVGNSIVWITGEPSVDIVGRSVAGAGMTLLMYTAIISAGAAAVFRARDVT